LILLYFRETKAKAVRLNFVVCCTYFADLGLLNNVRQQSS